jgi:hypothetical protein
LQFGTASNARATIDSSGNVGIGTTSPSTYGKFAVLTGAGSGSGGPPTTQTNSGLTVGGTGTTIVLNSGIDATGTPYGWMQARNSGSATYYDLAVQIAGGNLLIGTTNATASAGAGIKLLPGATASMGIVGADSTSGNNAYHLYSTNAGAYRFYVGYDGVVHATSTSISAISDASLKTNVKPLETGLAEVMALQPRRFDWINGDGTNVAGFIAQEVETVLPDLVTDAIYNETETKKNLKMGDMIPTLVKAIQEQQALITAQAADIAALKAKVGV